MIVCLCHRISDRDIAREVLAGCPDFETLQDQLRVTTACGSCGDCAREVFDEHLAVARGATWRPMKLVTPAEALT